MDLGLKGKKAVVLASSQGLGKATAKTLVAEGAHVLITGRHQETLEAAKKDIDRETDSGNVAISVCDITDPAAMQRLFSTVEQTLGTIDILVNNAGGPPAGGFEDFSDEDWQQAFELNLLSFVRAIRYAVPFMKQQGGGRIINIASSSIKESLDHLLLSNTFRAGILGMSKSLAREFAADGILINTVGPGRIATDRVAQLDQRKAEATAETYEQVKAANEANIPMGRYGDPAEFARMIVYLASAANTYVTGQAFVVDGGMVKAL